VVGRLSRVTSEVIRFAPGLKPVLKHQQGGHDQKTHGQRAGAGGKTLRNQDDPMNPETAWVHEATWYHGTSRPDLDVLDARGRARYPAQDRYYAIAGNNFATTDKELAAQYAREAADMDIAAGVEGVRPTVYRVVPTSDYFDPDPHSGPSGWNDGPEDMNEAFDAYDNGSPVSVRFQDVMDIDGAFDANTGEELSVTKMLEMLKHLGVKHDQKTHGRGSSVRAPFYDDLEDSRREAIEYLTGERLFPPSYSEEGVGPPTITISDSFKSKVNAVRRKVKAWGAERERRELAEMTPSEVAELAAVNQSRGAKREGARSPSSWEGLVPSTWVNPFAEPAMAKAADNVLRILYRVFKDVVDEDVWAALVMDPRPLDELDGPLGDLLDDMLDAVAPKPSVVKFAPGLRPVLKHQQGSHDQKTHGTWATGGAGGDFSEWGSRAPQIREIAEVAPPLADLERLLANPEDAISLRTDDLIADLVEERKDLIESFPPDVTMVNPEDLDFYSDSEREFLRQQSLDFFYEYGDDFPDAGTKYDALRDYMRPTANFEFVKESLSYEDMRRLRDQAQGLVEEEMIDALSPGMEAVFGISHPVTLPDGSSDVMEVLVRDVEWSESLSYGNPTVRVQMDVVNDNLGLIATGVQREFSLGFDGKLQVENVYLKIEDDAYKGKGFATVFNERAYDAYISQGVESVTVGTAWDGGFVWANKGFAWDSAAAGKNVEVADTAIQKVLRDPMSSASTLERAAIMLEQTQTQWASDAPLVSQIPTPMEIAMLGYGDQGTGKFGSIETTTWPGKTALYDARWKGRKELTPENLGGIARSKADMRRPQPTQQIPGQQPLFDKNPVVQQPSAGTAGGRQSLDEEIMDLLQPIGKAKQLSYWDKIEQQAEFYEKWIMETGRGLEEEDPDSMDDFFAAAVEAMPWLVE
jgi:hypothetical protein